MNNQFFSQAEAFVTIARCGSITAAAEELGTTKSGISQKLSSFEARLGLRLFDRTTRQLSLTEAGTRILEICRPPVEQILLAEQTIGFSANMDATPEGRVTLSGSNSYLTREIVPRLSGFQQKYPNVEVFLKGGDKRADFAGEDIDLGIRVGPVMNVGLLAIPLRPLQRHLCASPTLLDRLGHPNIPEHLTGFPSVLREQEKPIWTFSNGRHSVSHHVRSIALKVNSIELAYQAVLDGIGIALLADIICADDLATGKLVRLLPEWQASKINVSLLARTRKPLKPQVEALRTYLIETLA